MGGSARCGLAVLGVFSTALSVAGCESNPAIFRHIGLSESDEAIVTDAKQRIVTRTTVNKDPENSNRIEPRIVTCSEPSPDVAQAISTSITAALAATLKSGDSIDAGISKSTAESIAQLGERIATIQLLRDELADLCRSYANGAVTATTYTLRLSKLDRKMVTLLLGEMAAGAFGRSLANISGSAGAGGGEIDEAKLAEAQENVKNARAEVDKDRKALEAITEAQDPDGSQRSEARANLAESTKALHAALQVELAIRRGQLAANSGGSAGFGIGSIARQLQTADGATAEKLATIQRQFLEHDDLGTFIDACLTSMDLLTKQTGTPAALSSEVVTKAQKRAEDALAYRSSLLRDLREYRRELAEIDGMVSFIEETKRIPDRTEQPTEQQLREEIAKLSSRYKVVNGDLFQTEEELKKAEFELEQAEKDRQHLTAAAAKTPLSPLGTRCQQVFPDILESVTVRHNSIFEIRKIELEAQRLATLSQVEAARAERLKEEAKTNTTASALAISQENLEQARLTTEMLVSCRAFIQSPPTGQFPDAVKEYCTKSLEKITPK